MEKKEDYRLTSGALTGRRVVVTAASPAASGLGAKLRELGADVIALPTIRIEPPTNLREFAELVQDAHGYDWIIFATPESVSSFFDMFYKLYDDARELGPAKVAALGAETARRVKQFYFKVEAGAAEDSPEGLVRELKKLGGVENLRVLIARGDEARDVLSKELSLMGGIVDEGIAYQTAPETGDEDGARQRLLSEGADLIVFSSPAEVENFLALGTPWPNETSVACLDPATSKKARDLGLRVAVEARPHDGPGLIEAIRKFYRTKT